MTLIIKASDVQSSEFLDTADKVADALIVVPSYLMRSPSQNFAIENGYSRSEAIYELAHSIAGTVLKIDTFAGYVKGNIGLHFIKTKAPMLIDIASLVNGDYKVLFFVNYHEYLVGQEGQLSDLEIRIAPQSDSTIEGTKLLDFSFNSGSIDNVSSVELAEKGEISFEELTQTEVDALWGTGVIGGDNGTAIVGEEPTQAESDQAYKDA